jgi:uncharacterized membrane protein
MKHERAVAKRDKDAITAEFSTGLLPHPELLERYKQIQPDFPERMLRMAEEQSVHRQSLESKVITGNVTAQHRGQIFALVIAVVALGCGTFLIYTGH